MDVSRKRAALFEYFKALNNPKWVTNGEKLFKALNDMKEPAVDAMYARMLELKAKSESLKKAQEAPMYKRWKMPLAMLCVWGGNTLLQIYGPNPSVGYATLCAFIAGGYFQELTDHLIYNYVEHKYSKDKAGV